MTDRCSELAASGRQCVLDLNHYGDCEFTRPDATRNRVPSPHDIVAETLHDFVGTTDDLAEAIVQNLAATGWLAA